MSGIAIDTLTFNVYGSTVREIQEAIGNRMRDTGATDWDYKFKGCEMWKGGNMGYKVEVTAWRTR